MLAGLAGGRARAPAPALRLRSVVFLAVALAGLYDFWRWEYDYGHDLDPTAAIRIPGMSYQPPLIGGKQLLNFHATSWPDVGGWAAIAAVTVIVAHRGPRVAGGPVRRAYGRAAGGREADCRGSMLA